MTSITVTCGECGSRVNLSAPEVTVNEYRETPERSTYSFTCPAPHCGRCSTKHAPFDVLVLLASARGVQWNVGRMPAELDEAHEGAPLDYDDLHDFMVALASTPDHLILQLAGD